MHNKLKWTLDIFATGCTWDAFMNLTLKDLQVFLVYGAVQCGFAALHLQLEPQKKVFSSKTL